MSLGPGLFALDPNFRAIAVMMLFAGVFLMISGLVKLSSKKAVVYARRRSRNRILKAFRRAPETTTLQILQAWFPEEDFIDSLGGSLLGGVDNLVVVGRYPRKRRVAGSKPNGSRRASGSRALITADRFKGSLPAPEAASSVLNSARPSDRGTTLSSSRSAEAPDATAGGSNPV
jgi:hypothetical protein